MKCSTDSCSASRWRSSPIWRSVSSAARLPWILLLIAVGFCAVALGYASGCASRTVLVSESSPTRIGPDFRGRVYTLVDGEWRLSSDPVEIPEGWYMVPPSFVEGPHQ
jgi:hypothetical protein